MTGGAGFIGSHVVEALLKRGWEVVVIDDFSSGREENLAAVIGRRDLRVIRGDILDRTIVSDALKNVDDVFHEAATVSVQRSIEDPLAVNQVNVQGTLTLLEESRRSSVHRFVYASSCGVYGKSNVLPISEASPVSPLNPYAASKAASEDYCMAYHSTYGLEAVCLRYANVYGPRRSIGPYGGVMVKFAECLARNSPPLIFGDGTQTRDFVYSADVVEATIRAAESPMASGGVINIGTGVATSINELAELMSKITGKTHLGTTRADPRPGEIAHSKMDTCLARKVLGFQSTVTLPDGITRFLSWYETQHHHDYRNE